jgi:hypothetical protein
MVYETKDSGERQQFASGMQRDVTEGKTKWHLIFSGPMLERWAKLMTRGAIKYDDNNWMKADSGEEHERFKESAFRHFMQWYEGAEDEDHAAAIYFNVNGAEYTKGNIPTLTTDDIRAATSEHAASDWSYLAQVEAWEDFAKANTEDAMYDDELGDFIDEVPLTEMDRYREQLEKWNTNAKG